MTRTKFPRRTLRATGAAASASVALALGLAAASLPAQAQNTITFKMIGQPAATGLIQKNKEAPYFSDFAKNSGLPIEIDYKASDQLGIKDTEQLRVLKSGLFDIASLRVAQNSRDEPTLMGLDLVGSAPDYATARKIYDAYFDTLDKRLQKQFQVKMLGAWPFGPQIVFCKKPIAKLADLKGLKVRVTDLNMAKFVESVGASPVTLPFVEVHQSLSLGVVDCAITGPSSANSSAWPEVTTHQYPLGFGMAYNAYTISMRSWNRLKPDQQAALQKAITTLTNDIWRYSESLWDDAVNCNTGKDPCTTGKKFSLVAVPVQADDIATVRKAVASISLPTWAEVCDKPNPTCSADWKKAVGPVVGIQ